MKYIIGLAFVFILGALAYAGAAMLRGGREGKTKDGQMMRALAMRIAVSVLLFVFILLSYKLGWIHPTGLPAGR
ncbi:MAG: DUF2909 domain-containing protein [Burkholderiaceae bacterium]|nr:DUF2909 domain-containing protein [Burkholderiaceae bacterium]